MSTQPSLHLTLPAVAGSVGEVRRELGELLAPFAPEEARKILMAVNEAATNVVVHAYHDQPAQGPLIVSARVLEEGLLVDVCDAGPGVRSRGDSPGLSRGMSVMRALSSNMKVHRDSTHTRVRMLFRAQPSSPRFNNAPSLG